MNESTVITFPTFIGGMTGIAYVRVGIRKVWVTLTDSQTLSIPRKAFPPVLPEGNALAFAAARLVADGPQVEQQMIAAIRGGFSADTIAALQRDIVRSYQEAIEFKPKGAN